MQDVRIFEFVNRIYVRDLQINKETEFEERKKTHFLLIMEREE